MSGGPSTCRWTRRGRRSSSRRGGRSREIPYGETITYGEQARRLGRLGAARAVGAANGRNPLSIVVPCHRVVGADGRLVGFGGGLDAKRYLLNLEVSVRMRNGSR